ncbi:membrane metallo-endopeptidase-like 1 [Rhipicephalus sanguineus]|uniref:membrane metallo-endopeptidase-like 1 n=1 Tax=Rhipicephalus sanguineus TaxID=34632 RepID=UPI0020C54031|nr:membrane metallo-endopeptidase-like 1 [Rhipicephalus sanguineus]
MAVAPESGGHRDASHETSEPYRRYRQNADESGSFHNTLSATATPDMSESLSDAMGDHVATAVRSSSNAKLTLVAVAVALFVVFVVLLMRYGYPKAVHHDVPTSSVCDHESCHEYSQLLRASLAGSVNPCHNFYAYVCHGVRDPGGTGASILSLTRERVIDALLDEWLRANDTRQRDTRVADKSLWAGKLLRMCVTQHGSGEGSLVELQRFMIKMNLTWPRVDDNEYLDTLGTLVKLSLFWNVDVWFSMRVLYVNSSTRRPTFRYGRSESYVEWDAKRKLLLKKNAYASFLQPYISVFGVNEADQLKDIAERLSAIEEETSGILVAPWNWVRQSGPRVLRVAEMQPNGSHAYVCDWTVAVAGAFNASTKEFADDAVVVKNASLLYRVNMLLQLNSDRANVCALAIGWSVVRDIGSFLDASLSQAYGMTSRNVAERCIYRLDQGISLTELLGYSRIRDRSPSAGGAQLTKPALTLMLFRRMLRDELLLRVRRVFHAVQDAAIEALDWNLWMDSGTKRRALFSARRIALVTRLPRASDLSDGETELPRLGEDQSFFAAWKAAVEHMRAVRCGLLRCA